MTTEDEKGLAARLVRVREALTDQKGDHGIQSWFRKQIARRTGWEPGKASVHRWVTEGARPRDPRALQVLGELEQEAADALRSKLEALE